MKSEFVDCTKLCLDNGKIAKWIIEINALPMSKLQILPKKSQQAEENFKAEDLHRIFVKSSTGFYQTEGGKPNGATVEGIKIMLENAGSLPVKSCRWCKNARRSRIYD